MAHNVILAVFSPKHAQSPSDHEKAAEQPRGPGARKVTALNCSQATSVRDTQTDHLPTLQETARHVARTLRGTWTPRVHPGYWGLGGWRRSCRLIKSKCCPHGHSQPSIAVLGWGETLTGGEAGWAVGGTPCAPCTTIPSPSYTKQRVKYKTGGSVAWRSIQPGPGWDTYISKVRPKTLMETLERQSEEDSDVDILISRKVRGSYSLKQWHLPPHPWRIVHSSTSFLH